MLKMKGITVNSFYDVNQKKYSEEELQMYKELTGMPLVDSYEELIAELKDGKDSSQQEENSKTRTKSLYKNRKI